MEEKRHIIADLPSPRLLTQATAQRAAIGLRRSILRQFGK